jgi:hypothetical protein
VRQRWQDELDSMERELRSDQLSERAALTRVRSYALDGVPLEWGAGGAPPPVVFRNSTTVEEELVLVRRRLVEYVAFGAVVRLPDDSPLASRVQPLHVVLKEGKKPRIVIDLSRNLNSSLHYEYFRYSSVDDAVKLSWRSCWFGKMDLSNCFLSFPLHPDAWQHFVFRLDGSLWQFRRMPFGLASAPRICTELLGVVAHALLAAGCRFVRYLDDFLFVGGSADAVGEMMRRAASIFAGFGLTVNVDKTEGPAQRLEFLGIEIDSIRESVSCSLRRVEELQSDLSRANRAPFLRRKQLESLIGKLSFAAQVLPGARPFMRSMHDAVAACRRPQTPVRCTPSFRSDVRHWIRFLSVWNGRQRWRNPAPLVFESDASLAGFSFLLVSVPPTTATALFPPAQRPGAAFCGSYAAGVHSEIASTHRGIGWCELLAVVAAAKKYAPLLRDSAALFRVDNSADVAIINRQATRSRLLLPLLRELYSVATEFNFSIAAVHIPGVTNVLADFLSRPSLRGDDPLSAWPLAHPDAAPLVFVSYVCSSTFAPPRLTDWLGCSPVSLSARTRARHILPSTPSSSDFATQLTSTRSASSPKSISAAPLSRTLSLTRSLRSPATSQRWRTGSSRSTSERSLATACTRQSCAG